MTSIKRRPLCLGLLLATLAATPTWAQDDELELEPDDVSKPAEPEPEFEPDDVNEPAEPVDTGMDLGEGLDVGLDEGPLFEPGAGKISEADMVAVVRNPFLKAWRLELLPQIGVTINHNIIRHYQFNLQANLHIDESFSIGLEGHLFADDPQPAKLLTGWQARRVPTVNKYNWGAGLVGHYVPINGKFVLFGNLIKWETLFTLGVGVQQTETITRNKSNEPFTNFVIAPSAGVSFRFFVTKWLTIHAGFRDYVFLDKFEDRNRGNQRDAAMAKAEADSKLVNHLVFQAGISVWVPFSFEYTTFR